MVLSARVSACMYFLVVYRKVKVMCSGGNFGGVGGGRANFRKFLPKRGLKTVFSSANGGGGVCRKFESFVGNLGGFTPPTRKSEFPPLVKCQSSATILK